jgi:hypothetical protein
MKIVQLKRNGKMLTMKMLLRRMRKRMKMKESLVRLKRAS